MDTSFSDKWAKEDSITVAKKLIKINPGIHAREPLYSNCAVIAGWLQSMRKKRSYLFKRVIFLSILYFWFFFVGYCHLIYPDVCQFNNNFASWVIAVSAPELCQKGDFYLKKERKYVMVMYLACDTFMENHLTTLDSTFFLKLMPENQGHSGRLTVYVQTPWPQDVFTNQIWDS